MGARREPVRCNGAWHPLGLRPLPRATRVIEAKNAEHPRSVMTLGRHAQQPFGAELRIREPHGCIDGMQVREGATRRREHRTLPWPRMRPVFGKPNISG